MLVALTAAATWVTACQPACEDRCASMQGRCFDGDVNAEICADQCTINDCVDCFRCLEEQTACTTDPVCEQRCKGCSRVAPNS